MLEAFADQAATRPDAVALVQRDAHVTYADLARDAEAMSRRLLASGLDPGEPITLHLPNCRELVTALLAGGRLGSPCLLLPPAFTKPEIVELHGRVGGRIALTLSRAADRLPHEVVIAVDAPVAAAAEASAPAALPDAPPASTPLTIQPVYRGLGRPLCAQHTASALSASAQAVATTIGLGPESVVLAACPLDRVLPASCCLAAPLSVGARVVIVKHPRPSPIFELIQRESVDVVLASPSLYQLLRATFDPKRHDISSVRGWYSVGPPVPSDLARSCQRDMGMSLRSIYGTTESLPALISDAEAAPSESPDLGRPMDGVSVEVVGSSGDPLPAGEIGTVAPRTPWGFAGYLGDPDLGSASVSGDAGHLDAAGRLHYTGPAEGLARVLDRAVDLEEVASAAESHPAVAQARARAEPDEFYGNLVAAEIVLEPNRHLSVAGLVDHLRERLAYYKVPSAFRFVREDGRGS